MPSNMHFKCVWHYFNIHWLLLSAQQMHPQVWQNIGFDTGWNPAHRETIDFAIDFKEVSSQWSLKSGLESLAVVNEQCFPFLQTGKEKEQS